MEALSKILEFIGKYAWAVCVTIIFVLFIPKDVALQIGISELRTTFKGPLWITLILTLVLAIGSAFQYIDRRLIEGWLTERRETRRREEENKRQAQQKLDQDQQRKREHKEAEHHKLEVLMLRLRSLDSKEKMWLKYALFHNVQTLSAQRGDRTAQSLCHKGIITEGSGNILDLPFHIPDQVWKYLLDHKEEFLTAEEQNDPRFPEALKNFRRSLWAAY